MGQKSTLSVAERVEVVLSLLRKEEPIAALSRRYQVSEQTLYRWRDTFLTAGSSGLGQGSKEASAAARRIEKLEKELDRRAQVIGELTIATDLLKKLQGSRS